MASGPEKAGRAGSARRCGLVEQGQKVQCERTGARCSVTAKPAPTWRIWAGLQCTASPRVGLTAEPFSSIGGEAAVKACGVTVAVQKAGGEHFDVLAVRGSAGLRKQSVRSVTKPTPSSCKPGQ